MKKLLTLLFIIFCMVSCENIPDEPSCWSCEFSTVDETWYETYCDMTYADIQNYEDQVYYETGGEIYVGCTYLK